MRKLLPLVSSGPLLTISIVTLSLITSTLAFTPANAAPNSIEINSISEVSCTSVEILFESSVPKKSLANYVITAAVDPSVGQPKNIKKIIKTKATGLITAEIKNLNPKVAYKFSVSAKTNKGKMINSEAVEHISLCDLMDKLSNLPADWGNPKPIPTPVATPVAAPAAAPIAAPAFTLSSSSETRTVNTAATGFTINSTGGAIASFAISATPAGMSFSTSTGALSGTPTSVAGATTYTITATNATGSATQTFALTVTAVVYTLRQTGPGGGTIFYVAANPFACGPTLAATCTYLEAGESAITLYDWAYAPLENATLAGIGTGYQNTLAMVSSGAGLYAGQIARAYRGPNSNNLADWYLPSKDELNQFYLLNGGGDGNISTYTWWSSTVDSVGGFGIWIQDLFLGGQIESDFGYGEGEHILPIRAF